MNRLLMLAALCLLGASCSRVAKLELGSSSSSSSGSSGSSGNGSSGKSSEDVIAKATAKPKKDFDEDAFYTLTTMVEGQEYALTFVPPQGVARGSITTSPSKAKVVLEKLHGGADQQWQFDDAGIDEPNVYVIYTKVSPTEDPSGILLLMSPDDRFTPTAKYREKYNRLSVSYRNGGNVEYWQLQKRKDGAFAFRSLLATKGQLDSPDEDGRPEKWNESRSLAAIEENGEILLVHAETAETPEQAWKVTKVGY